MEAGIVKAVENAVSKAEQGFKSAEVFLDKAEDFAETQFNRLTASFRARFKKADELGALSPADKLVVQHVTDLADKAELNTKFGWQRSETPESEVYRIPTLFGIVGARRSLTSTPASAFALEIQKGDSPPRTITGEDSKLAESIYATVAKRYWEARL